MGRCGKTPPHLAQILRSRIYHSGRQKPWQVLGHTSLFSCSKNCYIYTHTSFNKNFSTGLKALLRLPPFFPAFSSQPTTGSPRAGRHPSSCPLPPRARREIARNLCRCPPALWALPLSLGSCLLHGPSSFTVFPTSQQGSAPCSLYGPLSKDQLHPPPKDKVLPAWPQAQAPR